MSHWAIRSTSMIMHLRCHEDDWCAGSQQILHVLCTFRMTCCYTIFSAVVFGTFHLWNYILKSSGSRIRSGMALIGCILCPRSCMTNETATSSTGDDMPVIYASWLRLSLQHGTCVESFSIRQTSLLYVNSFALACVNCLPFRDREILESFKIGELPDISLLKSDEFNPKFIYRGFPW